MNTEINNRFENIRREVIAERSLPTLAHSPSIGNDPNTENKWVYWVGCDCNNCVKHSDPDGYIATMKRFIDEMKTDMNRLFDAGLSEIEKTDLVVKNINDLALLRYYIVKAEWLMKQHIREQGKIYNNTSSFQPIMPVQTLGGMGVQSLNFPK